jgi:hypothetical protein
MAVSVPVSSGLAHPAEALPEEAVHGHDGYFARWRPTPPLLAVQYQLGRPVLVRTAANVPVRTQACGGPFILSARRASWPRVSLPGRRPQ